MIIFFFQERDFVQKETQRDFKNKEFDYKDLT